jgi:hypothetical protein
MLTVVDHDPSAMLPVDIPGVRKKGLRIVRRFDG